jgi:hypothetical protein
MPAIIPVAVIDVSTSDLEVLDLDSDEPGTDVDDSFCA